MPLVVEMPGKCPKCGGRLFKRTGKSKKTGKQYTYYCCEHLNSKDEIQAMRLHDLGRPGEGQLSRLRLDHVQEGGPGGQKALLHQRGVLQLHPGGEAGRLAEKDGGDRGEEAPAQEAAEEGKTAEKKAPAAKKTTAKAAAKKPAAKAAASKKASAAKKPTAKKTAAKKTEEG